MTRDEFIKTHADKYLANLYRAFAMKAGDALSVNWFTLQVNELNAWLGTLHDSLTEAIANARKPDGATGKQDPPQTGGGKAGSAPAR